MYIVAWQFKQFFLPQKMDIGDCRKVHSAALKADYEAAAKCRDYGYELDVRHY